MNKLTVIGRLASDPQIREISGSTVCNFRVAATTRRKDENGEYISNFYNVDVWRALGENCSKYLHKGDRVAIVGELVLRSYVDTKGQQRYSLDLSASDVEFLTEKREETAAPTYNKKTSQAKPTQRRSAPVQARYDEEYEDDEPLPF